MATKKFIELQELADDVLKNELVEAKADHSKMTFEHAIKGLENPLVLREVKRDVARLHTEIRRREIAAMSPEQLARRTKIRARRK
jgi:large subunit ribosomal protein L29